MPIINTSTSIETPEQRLGLFLTEQRLPLPTLTDAAAPAPSFGQTFGAAARTSNVIGSLAVNRVSRIMAGYSPITGDPTGIEGGGTFDPSRYLADPQFYEAHPYAVPGYDQLAGTRDDQEFDLQLQILKQGWDDMHTLAQSSAGANLTASLLVNIADPTNFVPIGRALKVARAAGSVNLARNVLREASIAAIANTAQEEALHAIQPGRPIDRTDADLAAAGYGFLFGGALGFLASPTWRPSTRGLRKFVPSADLDAIRGRVFKIFDQAPKEGEAPRNFVTALEDGQQALDELIANKPTQDDSIAVLHRRPDDAAGIAGDLNWQKFRQAQETYRKAGHELTPTEHPLQADYDAFSPLERTLNDTGQKLNEMLGKQTGAAPATAGDLANSMADLTIQSGVSLVGKAMSFFTPSGVFDKSLLDTVQMARRIFFYDGTVSKAAVNDPHYKGIVPAEALKDIYQAQLSHALQDMRAAYNPARSIPVGLGRGEGDAIRLQTAQRIAGELERQPITYTDASGQTHTIPARNHYNTFTGHAVKIMREQKAFTDGFIERGPQNVLPQLQKAADSIRGFFDQMLDLGDQVGLLPGKRTLVDAQAKVDDLESKIVELQEQQARIDESLLIKPAGATTGAKVAYTNIPEELHRFDTLFDWGAKGYRLGTREGVKIEGRRRMTFDKTYLTELKRIKPGEEPGLVRTLREMTAEIWEVKARRGKWWQMDHYLAPPKAIEEARARMAQKANDAFEQRIRATEERAVKARERLHEVQAFNDNAKDYFTRRFMTEAVKNDQAGFVAWLKRSWDKARNFGIDPETGERIRLAPADRPIIDAARDRLKLPEEIKAEGDLAPDMRPLYEQAVDDYHQAVAMDTWAKITQPDHAHGVEHAFAGGSPLMKRRLTVDEADPAAARFLDHDAERVLSGYFHTVGGQIATHTAMKRAAPMVGKIGQDIETPADLLATIDGQFSSLQTITAQLDREAGTNFTPRIQRTRNASMLRLTRRLGNLEGRGLIDNTAGANALWTWTGRQLLNLNYLALLGSQVLAAMNDAAALTLFSEVTSVPRNVGYLIKALAPLKEAPRRDLNLMRLAYEGEHSRVMALGDVDFDDPVLGVGYGMTRKITSTIGAGVDHLNRAFNEITLTNAWNRYIKRAGAMIVMDRITTNARRLLKAEGYIAGGMDMKAAWHKAGLSTFDAARMKELGFDIPAIRQMFDLMRKYGTDENGKPLADLTPDELLDFKGIMLPDAGRWLREEGDAARPLYDAWVAAINGEVERAMILTPGLTDRPLINDHWWGRAINQFQTFGFAWANQVLRPMAQRPWGKQAATVGAYFMTGAVVDAIRNQFSGRRSLDETAKLWQSNPWAMTYSVVNTSGLSGWFNRPLAFFDKVGVGPGAMIAPTVSRAAYQSRTFWGSLSPAADFIDRTMYGGFGWAGPSGMDASHWHALRKSVPFQNLIWFRLMNTYAGFDPLLTEQMMKQQRGDMQPRP